MAAACSLTYETMPGRLRQLQLVKFMLHVTQHILICLLLKFYKMLFIMKVIHKILTGATNYGPPCIAELTVVKNFV